MKTGIVGYPSAGKSTVYRALSGLESSGRGVSLATVKVPDPRVDLLTRLYEPRKTTYAELVFADLPGKLEQQSFSPETLGKMRDMDLLAQVLRGFEGLDGSPARPLWEAEQLELEFQLADLEVVQRRLQRLRKGDRSERPGERDLLEKVEAALEDGRSARTLGFGERELEAISGVALLTLKPVIYLLNVDEGQIGEPVPGDLQAWVQEAGSLVVSLSAVVEAEIAELDEEDRAAFLEDLGLTEPASDRFVAGAYERLDLISFFTVGRDEVRAWTIERGWTADRAAGRIHTDLQKGFIRADVTAYQDLVDHEGDEAACRKAGLTRKEGRKYVMADGDVINVHFSR